MKKKPVYVRITKLSDDTFNGQHPNGIYQGHVEEGVMIKALKLGERFCVGFRFSTSPVTKILKNKFKTTYSTYKIEYL